MKEVFLELEKEESSLRDYINQKQRHINELRNHITLKVDFVWRDICSKLNADLDWYSFSNDLEALNERNVDGSDGGFFDSSEYKEQINLIGSWNREVLGPYADGFPTRFLWEENYMEEVYREINKYFKKNQIKNELEKLKEAIVMFKDNDPEIINRINSFAELVKNEKI